MNARIYISDQHFITNFNSGSLRSIFNYGCFKDEFRDGFGRLNSVNEWNGSGLDSFGLPVNPNSLMLIIPLSNDLELSTSSLNEDLALGEIGICSSEINDFSRILKVSGKKEEDFDFLQLEFTLDSFSRSGFQKYNLPIGDKKYFNKLEPIRIGENYPFQLFIGSFQTRKEYTLEVLSCYKKVFAIALAGCFEVEERLIFKDDALCLEDIQNVGVECLSYEGLILLIAM